MEKSNDYSLQLHLIFYSCISNMPYFKGGVVMDTISHRTIISWRVIWICVMVVILIVISLLATALYFYAEHIKHQCYLENRKEFIEQHKEVQLVLAGETFCHEPRQGLLLSAEYKGKNLYKVKR